MADTLTRSALETFAADVRNGLSRHPRQLPPKYFYDDLGSALFDAICELPWYRITRAERALLHARAHEITRDLDDDSIVVELGSGNGEKLTILAESLRARRASPLVHLVDISAKALDIAADRLARADVQVVAHETTYEDGLPWALANRQPGNRALVAFLGSNIGNFEPASAASLLSAVRRSILPGDRLLLGADLLKPVADLLNAYDDPLGVTAAFNKNLLLRINRELGADFDLSDWDHQARWNQHAQSIEMHLMSRWEQVVTIPGANLRVPFAEGETIWTESSFKYDSADIRAMGEGQGFGIHAQWIDERAGYALTLFAAV